LLATIFDKPINDTDKDFQKLPCDKKLVDFFKHQGTTSANLIKLTEFILPIYIPMP
jgi:hypothetical protein